MRHSISPAGAPMMRSLLLLSLIAAPLGAQSTPEQVAEKFGQAILSNDWAQAARMMHPSSIAQLRLLLDPVMSSDEGAPIMQQLFGVTSNAEYAATADTILFRRLLENSTKSSGIAEALKGGSVKALGHIAQPGDTMLVVSRMTMSLNGVSITSYELVPVLLYNGEYRCLLKADVTNLANMLRARFKRES